MLDPEIVGKVIQRIREQKKQSQELVSGFAGIGRTHLSAIERGERKPTLETFFKIADALNIKPSSLMAAIEEELNEQLEAYAGYYGVTAEDGFTEEEIDAIKNTMMNLKVVDYIMENANVTIKEASEETVTE